MKLRILKSWNFMLMLLVLLTLQFCKTTSASTTKYPKVNEAAIISYSKDIAPIIALKCTPCHFPETGKKKMLDTYAATKDNIQDIIDRVTLPADHVRFMPFKNKKEPLTVSEISLLKKWVATGLAE